MNTGRQAFSTGPSLTFYHTCTFFCHNHDKHTATVESSHAPAKIPAAHDGTVTRMARPRYNHDPCLFSRPLFPFRKTESSWDSSNLSRFQVSH